MSRYFFNTENGRFLTDERGDELPSLGEARRCAVRLLCELLPVLGEDLWSSGNVRVVVTDEERLVLFTLEVAALNAPAAGGG